MTAVQQCEGNVINRKAPRSEVDFPNLRTFLDARSVFIVHPKPKDPTAEQRMAIIEASGILSFWNDPEEDIYSDADGEAV